MDEEVVRRGQRLRQEIQGRRHQDFSDVMANLDPRVVDWSDGWIFGEVWNSNGLPLDDQVLVAVVALAATAKVDFLRIYLHGAIQWGVDPMRIHEALMLLPVYVGFPCALQALNLWGEVVRSERRRGTTIAVPIT